MTPSNANSRFAFSSQAYWNDKLGEAGDGAFAPPPRLEAILAALETCRRRAEALGFGSADPSLLDMGCGNGGLAGPAKAAGWRYAGLDFVEAAIASARAAHPDCSWIAGDLRRYADARRFDVVVMSDVLCHLTGVHAVPEALSACRKALAPGGVLIIAEPFPKERHADLPHTLERPVGEIVSALLEAGMASELHGEILVSRPEGEASVVAHAPLLSQKESVARWKSRHTRAPGEVRAIGKWDLPEEEGRRNLRGVVRYFTECLARLPYTKGNRRVLDVGCGFGHLADAAQALDMDYVGIDAAPEAISAASARRPDARFVEADLLSWREKGGFDVVLVSQFLAHIPRDDDLRKVIGAIAERLDAGGVVVIREKLPPWCREWSEPAQVLRTIDELGVLFAEQGLSLGRDPAEPSMLIAHRTSDDRRPTYLKDPDDPESPRQIAVEHAEKIGATTTIVEWMLGNACTYQCSYCPDHLHDASAPWIPLSRIERFCADLHDHYGCRHGKTVWLQYTGGEPTLHPRFFEILKAGKEWGLRQGMITNGSRPTRLYEDMAPLLDHVVLTFHSEFAKEERFAEAIGALANGPRVHVNVPMPPNAFDAMHDLARRLAQRFPRASVTMKPLRVDFGTELYPYSDEQLRVLAEHDLGVQREGSAEGPRSYMQRVFSDGSRERKAANAFILAGENRWFGWNCGAGLEALRILPDGQIFRALCGVGGRLGNITTGYVLPDAFVRCDKEACGCVSDILLTKVR